MLCMHDLRGITTRFPGISLIRKLYNAFVKYVTNGAWRTFSGFLHFGSVYGTSIFLLVITNGRADFGRNYGSSRIRRARTSMRCERSQLALRAPDPFHIFKLSRSVLSQWREIIDAEYMGTPHRRIN